MRTMRVLVVAGLVREVDVDVYALTAMGESFTAKGMIDGLNLWYVVQTADRYERSNFKHELTITRTSCQRKGVEKFLPWAKNNNYEIPRSASDTSFSAVYGCSFYDYIATRPTERRQFDSFLADYAKISAPWHAQYPVSELDHKDLNERGSILIVDIGGSLGYNMVRFAKDTGNLPGRIVVQDLGEGLPLIKGDEAAAAEMASLKIETMPYDFFESQPLKGRCRRSLHQQETE